MQMRGRMRFTNPILPLAIIVTGIACISSLVRSYFWKTERIDSSIPVKGAIQTFQSEMEYDPFADPPMNPPVFDPNHRRIKAKFVEIGSGTESLKHDWIIDSFPLGNESNIPPFSTRSNAAAGT
jgi:hypothetical protein